MSDAFVKSTICANCNTAIIGGDRFCTKCGAPVKEASSTAASAAAADSNLASATQRELMGPALVDMGLASDQGLVFSMEPQMTLLATTASVEPVAHQATSESLTTPLGPASPRVSASPSWINAGTRMLLILEIARRLDWWFDLLDAQGAKVVEFEQQFREQLLARQMPGLKYEFFDYQSVGRLGEKRPYLLMSRPGGCMMHVYISQLGQELYLAWDLWVRLAVRWPVVISILVLSLLCGPLFIGQSVFGLAGALFAFVINIIFFGGIVAFAGRIFRNNFAAFFLHELNDFDIQDLRALSVATDRTLRQVADRLGIQSLREKDFQSSGGEGRKGKMI